MILSSIIVSALLNTVSYYKNLMALISCLTGDNIGCYLLMFQNVGLYILIILYTLAIMFLKEFDWSYCVISGILVYKLILN